MLRPENPFGIRLLDCRAMTWGLIATTRDRTVAERYLLLRESDGKDLIHAAIPDPVRVPTSLKFPHDGARLEGVVFKAASMDVKWDIYIYNSVFLFARSWTGDLRYRATAEVGATEITITEIECSSSDLELASSHVYFLIGTHAMGRVLPHRLPAGTPHEPMTIVCVIRHVRMLRHVRGHHESSPQGARRRLSGSHPTSAELECG